MIGIKNELDKLATELNNLVYKGSALSFPYLIGYIDADGKALYINERLEQAKFEDGSPFFWKPNLDAFAFIGNGSASYDTSRHPTKIAIQVDLIATFKGGAPIRLLDCLERFFSRCKVAKMVKATIDPASILLGEYSDEKQSIKTALMLARGFISSETAIVKVTLNIDGFANSAPITELCPCEICKKC